MKTSGIFIVLYIVVIWWYGLTSVSVAQENRDEKIAALEEKINEMQEKYEGQINTILDQYQKTQQQLEKALNMIEELKKDGGKQAQDSYTSRPLPEGRTAAEESRRSTGPVVSEAKGEGEEGQGLQAFDFGPAGGEEKGAYDFSELLFEEIKLGPVEWHGRLESRYINIADERNVDNIERTNSFEQSTFALWAGMEITDDIEVLAEMEFEPGEESANEIRLDQARLTWDLIKLPPVTELMPEYGRSWGLVEEGIISFTFGKFYYPFGIERFSYSGPVNKLVDRPSPFRQIIPGTYSDVGVKLHGLVPIRESLSLRHEIALTNGLRGPLRPPFREDRQNKDLNANKQIGGRLGLSLRDWFEIGGSFIVGKYHTGSDDQDNDETLSFFGGDMRVTYNKIKLLSSTTEEVLDLRGEYVFNHFNQANKVGPDFSREGWYVQAAYKLEFHKRFLNYIEPVFRYDSLDDDVKKFASIGVVPEDPILDVNRYAFGIGWSPFKHFRIKGEYEISDEQGDTPEIENNAFLYEMSIDW